MYTILTFFRRKLFFPSMSSEVTKKKSWSDFSKKIIYAKKSRFFIDFRFFRFFQLFSTVSIFFDLFDFFQLVSIFFDFFRNFRIFNFFQLFSNVFNCFQLFSTVFIVLQLFSFPFSPTQQLYVSFHIKIMEYAIRHSLHIIDNKSAITNMNSTMKQIHKTGRILFHILVVSYDAKSVCVSVIKCIRGFMISYVVGVRFFYFRYLLKFFYF